MPKPKESPDETVEIPAPPESVEFTYGDITVSVPRDADDWPARAELARIKYAGTRSLEDGLAFIEQLLGPKQWALITSTLKRGEFFEFTRQFSDTVIKECTV